jgi:hypothetical protein
MVAVEYKVTMVSNGAIDGVEVEVAQAVPVLLLPIPLLVVESREALVELVLLQVVLLIMLVEVEVGRTENPKLAQAVLVAPGAEVMEVFPFIVATVYQVVQIPAVAVAAAVGLMVLLWKGVRPADQV